MADLRSAGGVRGVQLLPLVTRHLLHVALAFVFDSLTSIHSFVAVHRGSGCSVLKGGRGERRGEAKAAEARRRDGGTTTTTDGGQEPQAHSSIHTPARFFSLHTRPLLGGTVTGLGTVGEEGRGGARPT